MIKASNIVVTKVKKASINSLVRAGHTLKQAEVMFDNLMDKLAINLTANVGGVSAGAKAGINPGSITPQGQKVRQLVQGQNVVNTPAPSTVPKLASDHELMLTKAAVICTGVKHGLSPLTSLLIFDQQLEKYADVLIKASDTVGERHNTLAYLADMRRTGLKNTQNIGGFNVQDPLSQQRINAIINGLASVPLTAGTSLIEGGRNVANKVRGIQPK